MRKCAGFEADGVGELGAVEVALRQGECLGVRRVGGRGLLEIPATALDARVLMAGVHLEFEIVDLVNAVIEAVLGLRARVRLAHRNLPVFNNGEQPLDVGTRDEEIPVRAAVLDDLRMFGLGHFHRPGLEFAVLDDLLDHFIVGLVDEHRALPRLRQLDGGVLDLDPEQRPVGARLDTVRDHPAFEQRRVFGLRFVAQGDLDFLSRLENLVIAEGEFPLRRVAVDQHEARVGDTVHLATNVDRQQLIDLIDLLLLAQDGGSDDAHDRLAEG
ncbi:MAG: hypothetical protein AW07_04260 [Candidatus Accumulibacter sp. SK-11]|nr:MAG: hypothetical protein AW07_04260 [Candidatus Accumulibacter sp. SK-11]